MVRRPSIRSLSLGAVLVAIGCAGAVDDDTSTRDAPSSLSLVGTYTLVRAGSGKCLDVQGGGNADLTNIQQWSCNGSGAQLFRFEDIGGGNVRLVNPQSGKCVDINAAGTADGTNVQLYTCNGTAAQSFALQDQGNGYRSLMNPHSGKCVDVSEASNADGANAQLWTCNGTAAQQWMPSGSSSGGGGTPPGWTLTWSDEFNGARGAIDGSKWSFDTGNNGWGNSELEYYTNRTDNAVVDGNGNLQIVARAEAYGGSNYTSARINTGGKFSQAYGRAEARIKLPSGKGIWPAFWMLGANIGSVGWPTCGELDIMEAVGDFSVNHGSCHGPGYSGGADLTATYQNPGGVSLANDFHVYAVEWQPNQVQFFVDGKLYETRTPADIPGKTWVYDHPFFIILNVAVGGNWPGSPDGSTVFPQTMLIDYVRVYKKS
jgi:beta-glucanase (GH16 family)